MNKTTNKKIATKTVKAPAKKKGGRQVEPVTKALLISSFQHPDALAWMDGRNDREATLRRQNEDRDYYLFSHRAAKLSKIQIEKMTEMARFGWTAMCVVIQMDSGEALLLAHSEEVFGMIYPDGELDRADRNHMFRNTAWNRKAEAEAKILAQQAAADALALAVAEGRATPEALAEVQSQVTAVQTEVVTEMVPVKNRGQIVLVIRKRIKRSVEQFPSGVNDAVSNMFRDVEPTPDQAEPQVVPAAVRAKRR